MENVQVVPPISVTVVGRTVTDMDEVLDAVENAGSVTVVIVPPPPVTGIGAIIMLDSMANVLLVSVAGIITLEKLMIVTVTRDR